MIRKSKGEFDKNIGAQSKSNTEIFLIWGCLANSNCINGKMLKWIKTFLSNHRQIVKVNGVKSIPLAILSGITRGSVMGPILFVIYIINNLPKLVKCDAYVFADDSKILRQITTKQDGLQLQSDINSLKEWPQKWLLTFHPKNSHVLTLAEFYNISHTEKYTLHHEKKFGGGETNKRDGWADSKKLRKISTAFIWTHLEYGQVIWAPYLKKCVTILENVQRRATKFVMDFITWAIQEYWGNWVYHC